MSSALMIQCPVCKAPPGSLCRDTIGGAMPLGHKARQIVALEPDGDIVPFDPDDLDNRMETLTSIEPPPQREDLRDPYADRTVLRWSRTFGTKTYSFAALKAEGKGWYMTGKPQEAMSWDDLWNKHIKHASWLERAEQWEDVHIIHDAKEKT